MCNPQWLFISGFSRMCIQEDIGLKIEYVTNGISCQGGLSMAMVCMNLKGNWTIFSGITGDLN